jgi:hypothetical protein
VFNSFAGQLPFARSSNASQDSETVKAMKLMLAAQHMAQMASFFSNT